MLTKDKMFRMIITDQNLLQNYEYDPEDYPDCASGMYSNNAIIAAVAMIVNQISLDLSKKNTVDDVALYKKILNHLNTKLIF